MTTAIKRRRGTTAQHSTFTGLDGELTIDTTKKTVVVHDGATAGGIPLAKETGSAISATTLTTSGAVTHNGGTANGITYLNASKVLTSGSALTFDGTQFKVARASITASAGLVSSGSFGVRLGANSSGAVVEGVDNTGATSYQPLHIGGSELRFTTSSTEQMRLNSSGLEVKQKLAVGYSDFSGLPTNGAAFAGSVGIGTSSPSAKLDVVATGNDVLKLSGGASATLIQFNAATTDDYMFGTVTSLAGLAIKNVTDDRYDFFISDGGSVGIGTSSPALKLHVVSSSAAVSYFETSDTVTGPYSIWRNGATSIGDVGSCKGVTGSGSATDFMIASRSTYNMLFGTGGTERMRIDSSGNIGIGTSNPQRRLTVQGNAGDNVPVRMISGTGAIDCFLDFKDPNTSADYRVRVGSIGDDLALFAGGTERMRIGSSGNVFINATTFPVVGIEKFGVGGGATIAAAFGNTSASNPTMFVSNSTNGSVTLVRFASGSGGNTVGNITSNGTNTSYNTSSDYRLKESIQPMTGALAKVAQLKPCTYKWKADGSDGQGFIAHELQEVVPECVTGEKDAVDAEGKPQYQGVDTSFLVATLAAALRELNAKFDAYVASHP